MRERVNAFVTPDDIGRIPSKISSSFSGFTAEQWKNWSLIFSLYSLKDFLSYQHYQCWLLFVKACYKFCRRTIAVEDINVGDKLILDFCKKFQQLYGAKYCNINMHLHTHLASCILDFGPVYTFWLFSFERLNGILGAFHTNCHDVSIQLMRRFVQVNEYGINKWPTDYVTEFAPLIAGSRYFKGSLMPMTLDKASNVAQCTPFPPVYEEVFSTEDKLLLTTTLNSLDFFPTEATFEVLSLYEKCKAVPCR